MAAEVESVTSHGYAVYSHHLVTTPKLVNYIEGGTPGIEARGIGIESSGCDERSPLVSYRFSLLSSNINVEKETLLRTFITKRLEQMQQLDESGIILSIPAQEVFDQNSMAYFYFMPEDDQSLKENTEGKQERKNAFLICFMAVVETGLDLFQQELDNYCKLLSPYVHKYLESVDVSEYLKRLESWFDINICYIQRCLSKLDKDLASLLFSIFLSQTIKIDGLDQETKSDLEKFIVCCSLGGLLGDKKDQDKNSLLTTTSHQINDAYVIIGSDGSKLDISSKSTNKFCHQCVQSLKKISQNDPIKLRQVIETYKTKLIQDMNTFKRLLKQAETDYYALYRSYVFLLSNDNGEVLLANTKVQCEDEENHSCRQVLKVIEQFIDDKMGFDVIVLEKSRKKAQNFLNQLDC